MEQYLEFAGNHPLLMFALLISFLLVLFTEVRRKSVGLLNLEAADAVRLINDDGVVIDIRNADAYSRGHIVNARSIPFDELTTKLGNLEKFKSRPVVAVCDAGITSNRAVKTLRDAGFEKAFGLKGGMAAWTRDGFPVVTGKKTKGGKGKKK